MRWFFPSLFYSRFSVSFSAFWIWQWQEVLFVCLFFWFILLSVLWDPWISVFLSVINYGKLSAIISSNISSVLISLSSPSDILKHVTHLKWSYSSLICCFSHLFPLSILIWKVSIAVFSSSLILLQFFSCVQFTKEPIKVFFISLFLFILCCFVL